MFPGLPGIVVSGGNVRVQERSHEPLQMGCRHPLDLLVSPLGETKNRKRVREIAQ